MQRRTFIKWTAGSALAGLVARRWQSPAIEQFGMPSPPAYSVIPVVGDGKYIWTKPPADETGYLEPRTYSIKVGIEMTGRGNAWQISAATPLPISCPEQKIEEETVESPDCQTQVRPLGDFSRQLLVSLPQLAEGQTVTSVVKFKMTLLKQYLGYKRDQFPEEQKIPNEVRRQYLGDSPGIETRTPEVRKLLAELRESSLHPWDQARKFAAWVPKHIKPQIGTFIGVTRALQGLRGDCEEMSAVFVALCRAAGIPARLVWVPNHNWSEFYLTDSEGAGHWIPAHTACYYWFGWTGAHELVIQKGDRLRVPERGKNFRLFEDWVQWGGRKPDIRYIGEITPLAKKESEDPGPGARQKATTGEWKLVGNHPLDRYVRR